MEWLKANKIKLLFLLIVIGFLWLIYLAFVEYSVESKNCVARGGQLFYDESTKSVYCKMPPRIYREPERRSWWDWF